MSLGVSVSTRMIEVILTACKRTNGRYLQTHSRVFLNTKCSSQSSSNIIRNWFKQQQLLFQRSHSRTFYRISSHYSHLTRTITLGSTVMLLYCWHIHLPAELRTTPTVGRAYYRFLLCYHDNITRNYDFY